MISYPAVGSRVTANKPEVEDVTDDLVYLSTYDKNFLASLDDDRTR